MPDATIYVGDALETLRTLPDECVQCCVTSPPYWGLRDYGVDGQLGLEKTPDEYVQNLVEVFREVRRVLRPDGTVWLNLGDTYASAWACNRHNEVGNGSADYENRSDRLSGSLKEKDLVGIPWRVALALQADGWWLRSDIIWCLSGGTKVYARTQKGEMPTTIKDLVRLDPSTVQLWNGEKWTQVLGWNESPRGEPLEIELRSGERIGCTPGHLWPTQRGNVRADELRVGDVIDTVRLPEPEKVYSPAFIGQRVAWAAGLYLAEGSRDDRGRLQFSGHTDETADRLAAIEPLAEALGGTARVHTDGNCSTIIVDCPALDAIIGQYVHGRTAKTKGVKVRAWKHNEEWLGAFLQGYLDGDGHHDEN
ncbi:MAG: hypothetical protein GVY12_12625, partial [Bacteroidetes bacterium]|nr:hypothetical protein [Bacteroidota bacterium]